jgi:hypothetical protein
LHRRAAIGGDSCVGHGNPRVRLDHGFELAHRRASVAVIQIAVVTLLALIHLAVTTKRRGGGAVVVACRGARWLAIFGAIVIDDSVAAELQHTARGATVSIDQVAIFALFGRRAVPVATKGCPRLTRIVTKGGRRRLASLGAAIVDDSITAHFEDAARCAAVSGNQIAVVTLLRRRHKPIAA